MHLLIWSVKTNLNSILILNDFQKTKIKIFLSGFSIWKKNSNQSLIFPSFGLKLKNANKNFSKFVLFLNQKKSYTFGTRIEKFLYSVNYCIYFKVACRVQIWKKTFCQNSGKFGYSFIKNDITVIYILCIYKKTLL